MARRRPEGPNNLLRRRVTVVARLRGAQLSTDIANSVTVVNLQMHSVILLVEPREPPNGLGGFGREHNGGVEIEKWLM